MTNILVVISKEITSYSKTRLAIKLSNTLQKKGNSTTIFLVEDGVYLAWHKNIEKLINLGIIIKAIRWDLKARGLNGKIHNKIEVKGTDDLFNEISEKNNKVLWF